MALEVGVILVLIIINGMLAGAEIAVVSVRSSRLAQLIAERRLGAQALRRLREDPERFLATVQVGITVVGATAAAFGGASLSEELVPWLSRVEVLAPRAEAVALLVVVGVISYLSVVVGELVPKSLALRVSERYALLASRPLLAMAKLAAPAAWILTASSNVILRSFGDRTNFLEGRVSLQELQEIVGEATRSGSIDAGTAELASRVIDMSQLTAEEVMVHRRYVVMLRDTATPDEVKEIFLRTGHRRIVVHGRTTDDVKGYVSWRDVMQRVLECAETEVGELLRPVHFVPQTRTAVSLLHEMREKRMHLTIVLDEHGGVAGLVTLEDLLEELVGEIEREQADPGAAIDNQGPADGPLVIPGQTPIRDVERMLRRDFGDASARATTMGGLAVSLAGDRVPATGESVEGFGLRLEILDASARRVRRLAVKPLD